jgi:hypothetical protein
VATGPASRSSTKRSGQALSRRARPRLTRTLPSTLREFYPAALDAFGELGDTDALGVLAVASAPTLGWQGSHSKITAARRRGGRQRRVDERAREIQTALRSAQLEAHDLVSEA